MAGLLPRLRLVTAKAAELGIEIIPEVDLPGHMMSAIKAYPHLGRPAGMPNLNNEGYTESDCANGSAFA